MELPRQEPPRPAWNFGSWNFRTSQGVILNGVSDTSEAEGGASERVGEARF